MITEKKRKVLKAARKYQEARERFDAETDHEFRHLLLIDVMDAQEALKAAAMEMGDE